eukprot:CAMPEP_0184012888 /NCGR_PEP_ID=MMETSP0954-20121128/4698_1 /TAXON_ID=627963 /ORGANISM="Aplanochytrium sp, Strain PBS07" /LENGTH=608 /DNA_ID=CAMNT_0026292997 /DNA_START=263 /DNA_END=2090 /DNA_ORIENTATION=+
MALPTWASRVGLNVVRMNSNKSVLVAKSKFRTGVFDYIPLAAFCSVRSFSSVQRPQMASRDDHESSEDSMVLASLTLAMVENLMLADTAKAGDKDSEEDSSGEEDDTSLQQGADEEATAVVDTSNVGLDLKEAMSPREVVNELDRQIVGQTEAKRAVAVALRQRWRRQTLRSEELRAEIIPKNLLMVGPTGCGKTEIARRLASITQSPFVKCEATKYTEVGFHGRDVDKIIGDLVENAVALTKKLETEKLRSQAEETVEDKLLDCLMGEGTAQATRASFREMLRSGQLEDNTVHVEVAIKQPDSRGRMMGPNNPQLGMIAAAFEAANKGGFLGVIPQDGKSAQTEKKKIEISEARPLLVEQELSRLVELPDLTERALRSAEENGIVFIDEIDKIVANPESRSNADASDEGVQRDLLPIIEGSEVETKYGKVQTSKILFICAGAFHAVNPSDLLPELQGRLPIRVELKGLSEDDMYRILTEPETNVLRQHMEMLATEGVKVEFDDASIRKVAQVSAKVNENVENIGARRLFTILEKLMEDISFEASEIKKACADQKKRKKKIEELIPDANLLDITFSDENDPVLKVTGAYVDKILGDLVVEKDLSHFIL